MRNVSRTQQRRAEKEAPDQSIPDLLDSIIKLFALKRQVEESGPKGKSKRDKGVLDT